MFNPAFLTKITHLKSRNLALLVIHYWARLGSIAYFSWLNQVRALNPKLELGSGSRKLGSTHQLNRDNHSMTQKQPENIFFSLIYTINTKFEYLN